MKIELVEHNPIWIQEFEKERTVIVATLPGVVVHHVGSTAVEDLLAKPVMDICLEAGHFPPTEFDYIQLASIGYENRGESGVAGRIWFTKGAPRKFNLHYCPAGSIVARTQLAFRDELRQSHSLRREYESLKLRFAPGEEIDSALYASAKDEIIQRIKIKRQLE